MSSIGKTRLVYSGNILPFILVTSLFFLWGVANNMTDTLLSAFKRIMSLTDFQTSWVQMAFYGAYFCLAIPAAIYIKKFSYKSGVILGLALFAAGSVLFYPASITMAYGHFLVSLYILAGGLSILETTANPYIIAMGPEESGTRRLNLAQSFNPIGSITGVYMSKVFILSSLNQASAEERAVMTSDELLQMQSDELTAVMGPYVGVAVFLLFLMIVIKLTKMPKASDEDKQINLISTFGRLIKVPHYILGVIAMFFYVGAQIGCWSYTIRYVMAEMGLNEDQSSNYYLVGLGLFTVSRFIFTFLMKFFSERKLLVGAAILGLACTATVMFGAGAYSVYALVIVSVSLSLMFPTIFGLGLRGLGKDTKIGGAGLIMGILGGAVLPAVQGLISDNVNISTSFIVPFICFFVVMLYGAFGAKVKVTPNQI